MLSKAIFLDKDGTLVKDVPYNVDPDLIQLTEGALDGLHLLQDQDYLLFIVTNQSGVARGYFEEQALTAVEKKLQDLLSAAGVQLTGFYYCPHHPGGNIPKYSVECYCRKPQPGMLQKAALAHRINLASSWLVGDILNDIEAGNRAGCQTVLIDNGNETDWVMNPRRHPGFIVKNLYEAASTIVRESPQEWNLSYGEKEHESSKHY